MRLFDYFRVAFKSLLRLKIRTSLTVLAITVGSLSLILMASLIIGIRQSLMDEFKKLGAFNLVTAIKDPNSTDTNNLMGTNGDINEGKKITDATLESVKKIEHVVDATALMSGFGIGTMRLDGSERKNWANINAIDPSSNVFEMPIIAGRKLNNNDMDKIVVGSRFVQDNKYKGKEKSLIGKKVLINTKMSGPSSGVDWGTPPVRPPANADESYWKSQQNKGTDIEAEIVGVSNNDNVGDGASYINLAWAKKLYTIVSWRTDNEAMKQAMDACQLLQQQQKVNKTSGNYQQNECNVNNDDYLVLVKENKFNDDGYTSIVMKVDDTKNLQTVSDEISKMGYGAVTAESMVKQINQIMLIVGLALGAIGGISLFVAAIGIINTMIMATYERTREIGVMRACGATRSTIRTLFTIEAMTLGFLGGILGVIISYIIGQIARFIVHQAGANFGNIPIDRIGQIPFWLIFVVIIFTSLLGTLAGLYPASRAARLNPVDALRYE